MLVIVWVTEKKNFHLVSILQLWSLLGLVSIQKMIVMASSIGINWGWPRSREILFDFSTEGHSWSTWGHILLQFTQTERGIIDADNIIMIWITNDA